MAINRIDFQGALVRTGDYSAIRQNEENKPITDQNAFQTQFAKEADQRLRSVRETEQTPEQKNKFDAKEKGKNEYHKRKDQKGKDEPEDDGGVIDMNGKRLGSPVSKSSFDFKV